MMLLNQPALSGEAGPLQWRAILVMRLGNQLCATGTLTSVQDDEAFEQFARAAMPRLYASAVLLAQDQTLANDLVQTTLLKVFVKWRTVQRADNPFAYARRVLYTSFLRAQKRRSVHWPSAFTDAAAPEASPTERLWLEAYLRQLPTSQRAVLVLRFYEDLPVRDVARILGCSPGTVKSRTSRALTELRYRMVAANEGRYSDAD